MSSFDVCVQGDFPSFQSVVPITILPTSASQHSVQKMARGGLSRSDEDGRHHTGGNIVTFSFHEFIFLPLNSARLTLQSSVRYRRTLVVLVLATAVSTLTTLATLVIRVVACRTRKVIRSAHSWKTSSEGD